jgi:hypothetical protein
LLFFCFLFVVFLVFTIVGGCFFLLRGWFVAKAFGGLGVTAGLAADRVALSGMVVGQQFFETDTNRLYIYTGSVWSLINNGTTGADSGWNNMNLTSYDANWTVGGGQYRKMPDGFVVFRSLVKVSTGVFFTLPVGYRPSGITSTMHLCSASGGIARIDVNSSGSMNYAETKAGSVNLGDWLDLSGIRFWAG